LRTSQHRKVLDRLSDNSAKRPNVAQSLIVKRASDLQEGFLDSVLGRLHVVTKLQGLLDQANVAWSASRMLVYVVSASLLATTGLLIAQFNPVTALVAGTGILVLPFLWMMRRRKKRIAKLMAQLPDVFDLMGQALRAGHALNSAIQLVSQQMPDPIATEFARVFHEQNLGIKVEEALTNMADRIDQMDVRFFVTSVLIQRQTGGDLAEILDKIGKVIRERIQLMGMVQALTAEGRLSGWVLLALPAVVFVACFIVNREYAEVLVYTPAGRLMLATAVIMDLMGMAMIKKIVNIKV
jgi:tight adherence protein B